MKQSSFALRRGIQEYPEPDGPLTHRDTPDGLIDASEHPPGMVRVSAMDRWPPPFRIVTVRDDLHQPKAAIICPTRLDKEIPYRRDAIVHWAVAALSRGIHLLAIDVYPSSRRDPQGLEALVWDSLVGESLALRSADKPVMIVSYEADGEMAAYVNPMSVGDRLPNAPLFLESGAYINVPLEETYAKTLPSIARINRELVESTTQADEARLI